MTPPWLAIALVAAVTAALRVLPVLPARAALPPVGERLLRYTAPAILAALATPPFIIASDSTDLPARVAAGLTATLTAWYTRSVALTVVAGVVAIIIVGAT